VHKRGLRLVNIISRSVKELVNAGGAIMAKIIGIDLGTSNSCAAVMLGGKPTIIPSAEGTTMYGKTVPSVVAFTKDGQILVGEPARRQAAMNPEGTITGIKRKWAHGKLSRFSVKHTRLKNFSFYSTKIKKDAEAFLGEPFLLIQHGI